MRTGYVPGAGDRDLPLTKAAYAGESLSGGASLSGEKGERDGSTGSLAVVEQAAVRCGSSILLKRLVG